MLSPDVISKHAEIHASLATFYMKLDISDSNNLFSALKHSELVAKLEPDNSEIKWVSELLLRQQRVEQLKHEARKRLGNATGHDCLTLPKPIQVSG